MIRLKAILNCLVFGVLPWWMYERSRHYNCSYLQHLVINLQYAWRWITYREDESDREFELRVNRNCIKTSEPAAQFQPQSDTPDGEDAS